MLKIYNPGTGFPHSSDKVIGCYYKNFLQFDIESNDFKHTSNIKDADIIAIHGHDIFGQDQIYDKVQQIKDLNLSPHQKLLILHIFHIDHCFPDRNYFLFARKILQQEIPNEFAIVHTNFALDTEISYDFLWNRQKIYFTDYNRINLRERLYVTGANIKNFELRPIEKITDKKTNSIRKYLCPNRIYQTFDHPRFKFRKKLKELIDMYPNDGHYSDFSKGLILETDNPHADRFLNNGGWYPIANHYYQGTYFSMYCETITGNENLFEETIKYRSITEKTWDPLIKGHFILPFGYMGLVDDIRSYGFKLPDWIDYSYDTLPNTDERFDSYANSAKKLLDLSIDELHELYKKDRDILVHNRELFWTRPYDSLHDKVINFFK
jgi:hypothetical protein